MTRWPTATIGSACTVFSGGTPSKGNAAYWHGTIPWVSAKDLKADRIFDAELHISQQACDESAAKMAPVGSLLMLVRGMGLANGIQVGEVTAPVAFNQDLRAIVPPPGVDSRFLLLALRHRLADGGKGVLSSAAHGTLKIDADALRQVEFPVPPPHEQRRIVAILDEAFAGIATAKANAEKNQQNAREVQDTCVATLLSPAQSWTVGPLSSFVESISTGPFGSMLHKSDYVDDGVPLVNPVNIVAGCIVPTEEKQVDEATAARLRSYLLRRGDIVVGRRGEIGRCAVVSDTQDGWLCGTGCFFIRPSSQIEPSFIAHLIRSPPCRARLEALSTGTTMQNLSNGALSGLEVALPGLAEQKRLLAAIDAVSSQSDHLCEIYKRKLVALDELKRSLLHQAFSGQLS